MVLNINPEWEVHPAQVKQWLDQKEDMLILDVRQLREWNASHIEGAMLLPLNELAAKAETLTDWKNRRVVTQCHHGVRSMNAAAYLRRLGFTNVHSMAGGLEAYSLLADPSVPRY